MKMLNVQNVKRAFEMAAACSITSSSAGELHRGRSTAWVCCLAEELRDLCVGHAIEVFTKHDQRNRERFGVNEFLYDIAICETGTFSSPGRGKTLHYIAKALWLIESELKEGDSTEWVKDFNKLVIGAAENKLFIGPTMRDESRESLLPIAKCCSGRVYMATIPHPSKWDADTVDVLLWRLNNDRWESMGS